MWNSITCAGCTGQSRSNFMLFYSLLVSKVALHNIVFKCFLLFTALSETFMNGWVNMGWPHRRSPTRILMLFGLKEIASVSSKLLRVKMLSYYETWWSERFESGFKRFLGLINHTADTHVCNKTINFGGTKMWPPCVPLVAPIGAAQRCMIILAFWKCSKSIRRPKILK